YSPLEDGGLMGPAKEQASASVASHTSAGELYSKTALYGLLTVRHFEGGTTEKSHKGYRIGRFLLLVPSRTCGAEMTNKQKSSIHDSRFTIDDSRTERTSE